MSQLKFEEKEAEEDLLKAALFVEEGQGEEEGAPQDGMAYLRAVRRERAKCADTVTVSPPSPPKKKGKKKSDAKNDDDEEEEEASSRVKAPPPPGCCPGVKWQREQVKQFSQVRLRMAKHCSLVRSKGEQLTKIPDKKNEALWCHLMVGAEVWRRVLEERGEEGRLVEEGVEGEQPTVSLVAALQVHVAETLLDYLTTWLEEVGWRPQFGPWLYSVLTRLEKPLTPDVSSRLRDLALLCSNLRRDMAAQGEVEASSIGAMNLLVCLVARYFDQGDMVDAD